MGIITVAIGLVVSFMSAITLLGVSAENYTYGTQFVVINISYLIGTPIVCYGFLPVFFNLKATSAYEVSGSKNIAYTAAIIAFYRHLYLKILPILVFGKAFWRKN